MTIDELHDYCRYLFDENHEHGVPDNRMICDAYQTGVFSGKEQS